MCAVCNTMYLMPLLSFACNTRRALLLFNCTQYNKCVSYIGSAWPCLSLLSPQQLMIDITVLTLIGSDTPSLSDSSHVNMVKRLICGDWQLVHSHRISSENTSRELARFAPVDRRESRQLWRCHHFIRWRLYNTQYVVSVGGGGGLTLSFDL